MARSDSFDLLVLGAGTTGAAIAREAASRGLRVAVVDRAPRGRAGARWVNGVPRWAFEEAGVPAPTGPELHVSGAPFHIIAGRGGASRVCIRDHCLMEVDMPLLIARLRADAEAGGARFYDEARVVSVEGERVETSRGSFFGDFIVDASGHAGAELCGSDPKRRSSLCAAAQELRRVSDAPAAEAFFRAHQVAPGETLCFVGVAGGYSVLNVRLDGDVVGLLTGSIPAQGYASGRRLLDAFAAEHSWVGETIQGGARAIPLGRPRDKLVRGRYAIAGDAACQVFPAHGSGIAPGLLAARLLVASIVETGGLARYERRWHRGFGGVCGAYEVFRRFSETLSLEDLSYLLDSGVMSAAMMRSGLEERMPNPLEAMSPGDASGALRALAARPALARAIGAATARMLATRAAYAAMPTAPALRGAWEERLRRLEG